MATINLHQSAEVPVSVEGPTIVIGLEEDQVRVTTTIADLPAIGQLYTTLLGQAVADAKGGDPKVDLSEVKARIGRCVDHADKLGSALIELRDEAKQREGRLMPPGVAETPPEAGTKGWSQ